MTKPGKWQDAKIIERLVAHDLDHRIRLFKVAWKAENAEELVKSAVKAWLKEKS